VASLRSLCGLPALPLWPPYAHFVASLRSCSFQVSLVDDQKMVWNNVQGEVGGVGPKLPNARGEMHIKFRRRNVNSDLAQPVRRCAEKSAASSFVNMRWWR
jgi:hypothetical protein